MYIVPQTAPTDIDFLDSNLPDPKVEKWMGLAEADPWNQFLNFRFRFRSLSLFLFYLFVWFLE